MLNDLPPQAFARRDESPDPEFYRFERLVTHIDAGAVAAVTQLYRQFLPAGGAVLDLMSSWVSHLPAE
ncbi:MAG: methyltransferase type 11, partial [Hymenobacter sp.]